MSDQTSDLTLSDLITGKKANKYDGAVGAVLQDTAGSIRNNVQASIGTNPVTEASYQHLAKFVNVPVETVRADPDAIRQQAANQAMDADKIAKDYPHLAQFMGDPVTGLDNTRQIHDSVPQTAAVEAAAKALPAGPSLTTWHGEDEGPTLRTRISNMWRSMFGAQSVEDEQRGLREAQATAILASKRPGMSNDDAWEASRQAIGGMSQIPQAVIERGVDSATMGLVAPVTPMATHSWQASVGAGVGQLGGFLVGPAKLAGMAITPLERIAGDSFVKALTKDVVNSAATLALASTLEKSGHAALDTTNGDQAGKIVADSLAGGAEMGAVFGAAGRILPDSTALQTVLRAAGVNVSMDALQGTSPTDDRPLEDKVFGYLLNTLFSLHGAGRTQGGWLHDVSIAKQAEADHGTLQSMSQAFADAPLRERNAPAFHAFVKNIVGEGGVMPDVYIDAAKLGEVLDQSGVTAQELATRLPEVARQMKEALETKGDVRIPLEDYATHIAGGKLDQAMLPELKTSHDAMTYAQSQEFAGRQGEELKGAAEKIAGEQAKADEHAADLKTVEDKLFADLRGTGRLDDSAARASVIPLREFYRTQAAVHGVKPSELYEKFPIKTLGQKFGDGLDQRMQFKDLEELQGHLVDHGGVETSMYEGKAGLHLGKIVVDDDKQNQGYGTDAMQKIVDYADSKGQRVTLTAASDFGGNKKRLIDFYKRFGFVENKGKNKDFSTKEGMYRDPKGASGELKQDTGAAPIARIAGEEIAPKDADIKALRAATKDWYAGNLKGTSATNEASGKTIEFRGADKAFSTSANLEKLRLFAALKDIVEKGRFGEPTAPKDPMLEQNVKAYHWLTADVVIDGKQQEVGVTIREDDKGHLYYNHNPIEKGPQESDRATPDHNAGGVSDSRSLEQSMHPDDGGVNIHILGQGADKTRGSFNPETLTIGMLKGADLSTFLHETGHAFLEMTADMAVLPDAPERITKDFDTLLDWFGVQGSAEQSASDQWHMMSLEEKRQFHEQFARGFEAYLMEGKAPSLELQGVFSRFRSWMLNIYKSLTNLNVELTPEVRGVFDRLLASDEAIKEAEAVRQYAPLFKSDTDFEGSGVTLKDYMEMGQEATDDAIAGMNAASMRTMAWTGRLEAKALKEVTKQANALRRGERIEAAKEIWAKPVYQAWQYLTGKDEANVHQDEDQKVWNTSRNAKEADARRIAEVQEWEASPEGRIKYRKLANLEKARTKFLASEQAQADISKTVDASITAWERENPRPIPLPEAAPKASKGVDPSRDSLFVAIAKLGGLNKEATISEWGIDPKDKPTSGVFGKPIWRQVGGRSLDDMAGALAEHGYIPTNEHGQYELRDFEEKFGDELRGIEHFSVAKDFEAPERPDATLEEAKQRPNGRLDEARIGGMEGAERVRGLKMASHDGLDPDIVADMFGFEDGQDLVRALAGADMPKDAIEGLTDQRMLERHGELADPASIERAAEALIHNEVRAKFMAAGLKVLTKSPLPVAQINRMAKEAAEAAIAAKRIRELSPGQYAAQEARANKDAVKQAATDPKQAAVSQRAALLNNRLFKAANDAVTDVKKGVDYLKKFDKAGAREGVDLEYRDQIDALLDRFDLRKSVTGKALDRKESLDAFVERMASMGYEPQIPEKLLNELNRQHYKEMTVEEFRGLVDAVKSIEHLGRLKTRLLDLKEMREITALADEAKATMAELPQRNAESNRGLTRIEQKWMNIKSVGRSGQAALLKMEQMFDWLDKRNPNGVLNRVVFRRISDATVKENDLLADIKGEIDKLIDSNLADVTKEKGKIYTAPGLIDGLTGKAQRFTKKEMLALAGNYGNESNLAKLAMGENWNPTAIKDFLDANMTKADWDFVAGMGRTLEKLWPEKLAMSRRLGNTNPEKIAPRPFDTPHGRYDGWYWPMVYDPARAADVETRGEKGMFDQQFMRTNTDTGRMNTRNANYARPLLLSLDTIPRVLKDEIHDIAFREAVMDVQKFVSHPTVRESIVAALGQEHYDQILGKGGTGDSWLRAIANDGKLDNDGMRALKFFNDIARGARTRATIVGLGYRLTTMLVHGSSAGLESVAELGPKWMGAGLKDFANPAQWTANKDFIFERSGEMRNRMNEVDRDVREHLRQIDLRMMDTTTGAVARGKDVLVAHAYHGIAMLDMASALPTWMGAYHKAMAPAADGGLGMGEADAVYFADKTVRNAHGGTGVKDMAAVQRGPEFFKLFTMFYTFWNHNVNRLMDTGKLIASAEHREGVKAANNWSNNDVAGMIIMRTLIYTLGVQAMHGMLHPSKDQDGETNWLKWAAKEFASAAFAGIPIARDLSSHFITGKDYSVTPAASMVDAIGNSSLDAAHAALGEHVNDKWLKHSITTAGFVFGLPTGQIASTGQFLWDVGNGVQNPQDATDWWHGMLHGDMRSH